MRFLKSVPVAELRVKEKGSRGWEKHRAIERYRELPLCEYGGAGSAGAEQDRPPAQGILCCQPEVPSHLARPTFCLQLSDRHGPEEQQDRQPACE